MIMMMMCGSSELGVTQCALLCGFKCARVCYSVKGIVAYQIPGNRLEKAVTGNMGLYVHRNH